VKKINKTEPTFYLESLRKENSKTWADVSNKTELRAYMLGKEQNNQCAYTEMRINSTDSHIDHYIKQDFIGKGLFRPTNVFLWHNLFAASNNEYFGAKYKDKNIKPEDYGSILNPAVDNPAEHLEYSFTGDILPKNNSPKGKKTIEMFNLNDKVLVKERRDVAVQIKSIYFGYSIDDLINTFGRFEGMIRYLCDRLSSD
jgi:uncharacterized protein (TIGR02646 family)